MRARPATTRRDPTPVGRAVRGLSGVLALVTAAAVAGCATAPRAPAELVPTSARVDTSVRLASDDLPASDTPAAAPAAPVIGRGGIELPPLPPGLATRPARRGPALAAAPNPPAQPTPDAPAEAPVVRLETEPTPRSLTDALLDDQVNPVECATCGTRYRLDMNAGGCPSCGRAGGMCTPGMKNCSPWEAHTFVGRFIGNLYDCLCCPDPCYQPSWVPEQNAGFFPDFPRPQTMFRLRWDYLRDMVFPDRNEYFWPRSNVSFDTWKKTPPSTTKPFIPPNFYGPIVIAPNLRGVFRQSGTVTKLPNGLNTQPGIGPKPMPVSIPTRKYGRFYYQPWGERSLALSQIYMYTEAATQTAAFFFEYPYQSVFANYDGHFAGFGDIRLGTKAVLLDCELLLATFQFKTYLPTGSSMKGLGTGHVSLEPSLIVALRVAQETYLEMQLGEWIPLGGDSTYAGALLNFRSALTHVLCRITPDVPVIGTLELDSYAFQDGAYTNPFKGPLPSHHSAYVSVGPGLRMSVCKRIDVGTSVVLPVQGDGHWASTWVRGEFRVLY